MILDWSLLGGTTRIYFMLFLIYIKLNHKVSTVKQLVANVYYFSLLYARSLAGKLNPYLKANLNGCPCVIQFRSELGLKITKSFYLDDKLNLYYHM